MKPQSQSADNQDWFKCRGCGRGFPYDQFEAICSICSDLFEFSASLPYQPVDVPPSEPNRLARFYKTFPFGDVASLVSLGEGETPLLSTRLGDREIHLKCEYFNPTGSFKDRGTTILVSALRAAGITSVVEDSSGNAGASLAAYAARSGIHARIFVPSYASGPKRRQIEAYGAEIVPVPGPRSATSAAVLEEAALGMTYASHAHLPHGLAGFATIAFEIFDQLNETPEMVVVPVGQGTLLLGLYMGFVAMQTAGVIQTLPRLIGVQAASCAPIARAYMRDSESIEDVEEGTTLAEGIRIANPLRMAEVLHAVKGSKGGIIMVEEEVIIEGRNALSRRGFYVEPTSAVVWPGIKEVVKEANGPVVAVLTGSGYKSAS